MSVLFAPVLAFSAGRLSGSVDAMGAPSAMGAVAPFSILSARAVDSLGIMISLLALVLLETAFIVVLLRKLQDAKNTGRTEFAENAREISNLLITAQEEERRRIARDLHDDLNQRLALLSVETDLLRSMENDPAAESLITAIASRVHELSSDVHKLAYQLHPARLEQLGLVAATRSLCEEFARERRCIVFFDHNEIPLNINAALALAAYRIVQEGLHNIHKHSGATETTVELHQQGEILTLILKDNGCGFDLPTPGHLSGIGLIGMRERVRLVRGRIAFHTAPGKGTCIEVVLPMSLSDSDGRLTTACRGELAQSNSSRHQPPVRVN